MHSCPTGPEKVSDSHLNNSEVIYGQEVKTRAHWAGSKDKSPHVAPQQKVENTGPQIF